MIKIRPIQLAYLNAARKASLNHHFNDLLKSGEGLLFLALVNKKAHWFSDMRHQT